MKNKDLQRSIDSYKEEFKKEQQKTEAVREEERKARVRLMEKTTEFTGKNPQFMYSPNDRTA